MTRRPPRPTLFPSPPLSRPAHQQPAGRSALGSHALRIAISRCSQMLHRRDKIRKGVALHQHLAGVVPGLTQRSEEHTSELQSRLHLVCRLLLEKKKQDNIEL